MKARRKKPGTSRPKSTLFWAVVGSVVVSFVTGVGLWVIAVWGVKDPFSVSPPFKTPLLALHFCSVTALLFVLGWFAPIHQKLIRTHKIKLMGVLLLAVVVLLTISGNSLMLTLPQSWVEFARKTHRFLTVALPLVFAYHVLPRVLRMSKR